MIPLRTAFALLLAGGIVGVLGTAAADMTTDQRLALLAAMIVLDLALIGFDVRMDRRDR